MKLLIADADQSTHTLLNKVLNSYSSAIYHAFSGDETYVGYHQSEADLIICSLDLPGMDIFAIHNRLNTIEGGNVPFIVMGKTNNPDLVRRVVQLGIQDFIAKPFDLATARFRIGKVCKRIKLRKESRLPMAV